MKVRTIANAIEADSAPVEQQSQYLYLLVKVRTTWFKVKVSEWETVAIPIPSGEGQNFLKKETSMFCLSQYLYLLVKVRTKNVGIVLSDSAYKSQYLYLLVKVRTRGRASHLLEFFDDVAIPIPSGEGQN